ncbi:uncharacterized protein KY384_004594 [Bacidia gigantensis]|uniref:uncharacterized protein n=1 Tax=Bacidia gigantensis TaxID=2732470 RepID=UPI001D040ACB|nr:uncharacterized protein KY384_004594 [Bacidia gigantensis]KAG8531236.1 hypothetical protein KY384_004594 [Bacidia gigantensis]
MANIIKSEGKSPAHLHEDKHSDIDIANTPSETHFNGSLVDDDTTNAVKSIPLLVPWPGSTFLIRSVVSGNVITLLNGKVQLSKPGGQGSIYWQCIEHKGRLSFRNPVSGQLLGFNEDHRGLHRLCCNQIWHGKKEYFEARVKPSGDCIMLVSSSEDNFWYISSVQEHDEETLTVGGPEETDAKAWEFLKV